MNESTMILSAFESRLRAGLVYYTVQTNPAVEQNKNVKWALLTRTYTSLHLVNDMYTQLLQHMHMTLHSHSCVHIRGGASDRRWPKAGRTSGLTYLLTEH